MLDRPGTRTSEEARERLDDGDAPQRAVRGPDARRHQLRIDRWMPTAVTLDVTWHVAPVP